MRRRNIPAAQKATKKRPGLLSATLPQTTLTGPRNCGGPRGSYLLATTFPAQPKARTHDSALYKYNSRGRDRWRCFRQGPM